VKDTIGQLLITTGSIVWTSDCEKALRSIATGSKGAMKQQKKKQVSYLGESSFLRHIITLIRMPWFIFQLPSRVLGMI
jgi:hypothetical protein